MICNKQGVNMSDLTTARNIRKGIADILKNKRYKLRDTQRYAFKALVKSSDEQVAHGYFRLPTGTGKTVMFSVLSRVYLDSTKDKRKKNLILVPRLSLIKQTKEKLKSFVGIESSEFHGHVKQTGADVIISTYQSLPALLKKLNKEDIGLIFADEAHHILGEKTSKILTDLIQDIPTIGFTATPDYDANKQVSNILKNEIFTATLSECVDRGELCPVKNIFYRSAIICNLSTAEKTGSGDYDYEKLKIPADTLVTEIAKIYIDGAEDNGKSFQSRKAIINCPNVEIAKKQAQKINELLGQDVAVPIYSDMPNFTEAQNKFKQGEFSVACQVGTMVEGYDDQEVSLCINYPTRSRVKEEQAAGRVLRINDAEPNKTAIVVDVMFKTYAEEPLTSVLENATNANQVLFYNIAGNCIIGKIKKSKEFRNRNGNKNTTKDRNDWQQIGTYGYILTDATKLLELVAQEQKRTEQLYKNDLWKNAYEIGGKHIIGAKTDINKLLIKLYNTLSKKEQENRITIRKWGDSLVPYVNIDTLAELADIAQDKGIILKLKLQRPENWKPTQELASKYIVGKQEKINKDLNTLYNICSKSEKEGILKKWPSGAHLPVCVNINKLDELKKLAETKGIEIKLADPTITEKPANWKSVREVAGTYIVGAELKLNQTFKYLFDACSETEKEGILKKWNSGTHLGQICVNMDRLEDFKKLAQEKGVTIQIKDTNLEAKPTNWKTGEELFKNYLIGNPAKITKIVYLLYDICTEDEKDNVLKKLRSGNRTPVCVNINNLDKFLELVRQKLVITLNKRPQQLKTLEPTVPEHIDNKPSKTDIFSPKKPFKFIIPENNNQNQVSPVSMAALFRKGEIKIKQLLLQKEQAYKIIDPDDNNQRS